MKRGKPPRRKTSLKWSTKRLKRTPIQKRRGTKAEREEEAWLACKRAVSYRSGGWCEADSPVCVSSPHRAVHPHHVWPEDRRDGIHDPERVLDVCFSAHRWIHDHPADAKLLGLLRPNKEQEC